MNKTKLPLIVICGPTASGKTSLAIKIAKQFNGEVVSADSRAVYKGLNIGTAKPSLDEQDGIPHWGIDLVSPDEPFSGAVFKQYATEKIADIRSRGKTPILVGGTGLYINSVVYDYSFSEAANLANRETFEAMNIDELHRYCVVHNIDLPENHKNKRYVINTILREGAQATKRASPLRNTIFVGITTDKQTLLNRISLRAETIFSERTYKEATEVANKFGWDNEAMTANVYRLIRAVVNNDMTQDQAMAEYITLDWRLAKRQMTWLKRDSNIKWFNLEDAGTYIVRRLENMNKS